MSILTQPRPSVHPKSRPLTVELVLTINGQSYEVTPIAPGPDNTRAYRLIKRGSDEKVYDVCQTAAGLVECDCPSYEVSYRGNGLETCKHGRALIMCGLVDYPDLDDARAAYDDAREAEALAARDAFEDIAESKATAARVVPPFDPDFYRAQNAVAEGRALWVSHRHLFTSDPAPCCDPAEPLPCTACVQVPAPAELPITRLPEDPDATDDDADHVHNVGPVEPDRRTLAERVDVEARHYRTLGTDFGDLIAEKLERLAAEIRFLEATTPESYRDRRDAAIDAATSRAEARLVAAGCL